MVLGARMKENSKTHWKPADEKYVGKYATIMHSITGETCINTIYGEAWASNPNKTKVMITNPTAATKIGRYFGVDLTIVKGEEAMFEFDNSHIDAIMKLMKYRNNRISMAKRANNG
jgi:hypothetical protein